MQPPPCRSLSHAREPTESGCTSERMALVGTSPHLTNMVLLCSRCHHDLHFCRFTITMDPVGTPQIAAIHDRSPPRTD